MKFGSYFKKLRISKKITQKQVADAIGKQPMFVSNVENGKNGPFSEKDINIIIQTFHLDGDEEKQLYKVAAAEKEQIPKRLYAYLSSCDEAYELLELLAENNIGKSELSLIIKTIKERL